MMNYGNTAMKYETAEAVTGVCNTCLSTDRRLTLLGPETKSLLAALIQKYTPQNDWTARDVFLCWECRAILRRLSQFVRQVVRAQAQLLSRSRKSTEFKTISSLKRIQINCITEVKAEIATVPPPEPEFDKGDQHLDIDMCPSDVLIDPVKELKPIVKAKQELKFELMTKEETEMYTGKEEKSKIKRNRKKTVIAEEHDPDYDDGWNSVSILEENEEATPKLLNYVADLKTRNKRKTYREARMYDRIKLSEKDMQGKREEMKNDDAYKKALLKCENCIVKFSSKTIAEQHRKHHTRAYGHCECPICHRRLKNEVKLSNHINGHYICYKCKACGLEAMVLQTIYRHCIDELKGFKKKTSKKATFSVLVSSAKLCELRERERKDLSFTKTKFKCHTCIKGFDSESRFKYHENTFHSASAGEYQCDICAVRVSTKSAMVSHVTRHSRCFQCSVCPLVFTRHGTAYNHYIELHERGKSFVCKYCSDVFDKQYELKKHKESCHRTLPCPKCDRVFKSAFYLKGHVRRHEPHACPECREGVASRRALSAHRIRHRPLASPPSSAPRLRPLEPPSDEHAYCVECDRQYPSRAIYLQHTYTKHSGKKVRSECTICGKVVNGNHLKSHMTAMHFRANLPYSCKLCDKVCRTKQSMAPPIPCPLQVGEGFCQEWVWGYMTKQRLAIHKRHVHENIPREKKHACDICSRAFHSKSVLVNHRRTHTGERPFRCEVCPAAFTQRYALVTHGRRLHKEQIKPDIEETMPSSSL